jgi:hypothetical protein
MNITLMRHFYKVNLTVRGFVQNKHYFDAAFYNVNSTLMWLVGGRWAALS